jgi:hypothetical protein
METAMPPTKQRGIGAVMIAFGVIGLLLWLAVARLSADTAFGTPGLVIAAMFLFDLGIGVFFVRRKSR